MSQIKVSTIIPTYRRSEDVARAVDSVLAQSLSDIEVIVVDDNGVGTPDGEKTAQVMARYAQDPRVLYLRHEENQNGAAARNTGIQAARGQYVAFLDDDDVFCPTRLEKMSAALDALDDSYGACYSGYVKHMPDGTDQFSAERAEGDVFVQVLMRSLYIGTGSNLFFRRSAMEDIGLFDVSFRRNQDLEYLLRITSKYKMAYVDEVLMEAFYDIRTAHMSFAQSVERERMFREKFAHYLTQLSDLRRREVLMMYELDWIRFCVGRKKFWQALKTAFRAHIPLRVFRAYLRYAADRRKNHTCYGFVVKL